MNKSHKFSPELCERAVRLVQEQRGGSSSQWAAVLSIGCVPQILLDWIKRAEVDAGVREGVTTSEAQRLKELEPENKELRRANEILKLTSVFSPRRSRAANSIPEGPHRQVARHLRDRADLQGSSGRPVRVWAACPSHSSAAPGHAVTKSSFQPTRLAGQ